MSQCENQSVKLYRLYYECAQSENKPKQSNFVSSTQWTREDSKWYRSQVFNNGVYKTSGPIQDNKITTSKR